MNRSTDVITSNNTQNFNSDVDFIYTLLNKYDWNDEVKNEILKNLNIVKSKINDSKLYLSIVGEFSTGKSTFINALLRDNLLESDTLQGTTTANTIIQYAPYYNIIITSSNKEIMNLRKPKKNNVFKRLFKYILRILKDKDDDVSLSDMKAVIKEITTTNKYSDPKIKVIIEHPSDFLKDGIVIIDTPGTNSNERWHEEVTKSALRDISDTSLILTTADKPLPETLNSFIKENMTDVLHHSIFIATKMDVVRENERNRQLLYIEHKINDTFDISMPTVLPYTPLFILSESCDDIKKVNPYGKSDYKDLLDQSYETEERIYQYIIKHKSIIQSEKILKIFKTMLGDMSKNLDQLLQNYQYRHDLILKHKRRNLQNFTNEMIDKYSKSYLTMIEDDNVYDEISYQILLVHNEHISELETLFSGLENYKSIKAFCTNTLKNKLEYSGKQLVQKTYEQCNRCRKIAKIILENFWEEFEEEYTELKAIDVKKLSYSKNDSKDIVSISTKNTEGESLLKDIEDIEDTNLGVNLAGGGIGAIIGSFILPGVGTAIGAYLGTALSKLFAPDFETVKKETWNKIAPSIDNYYNNVFDYLHKEILKFNQDMCTNIESQISNCLTEYSDLVDNLIKQDKIEKKELDIKISEIKTDMNEISNVLGEINNFYVSVKH